MSDDDIKEAWYQAKTKWVAIRYNEFSGHIFIFMEDRHMLDDFILAWIDHYDEYMTEVEGDYD